MVLYFFAGEERKGDIKSWLQQLCPPDVHLVMHEIDILRGGESHNLTNISIRKQWLEQAKTAQVVIATPPCAEFSRVKWTNNRGPPPLRSSIYPRGFPWLSRSNQSKIDLSNLLVDFTFDLALQVATNPDWQLFLAEHPENLGRLAGKPPSATPASIWSWKPFLELWHSGWWSGAFRQCDYGAPTPKPTRLFSSDHVFSRLANNVLPSFDDKKFYLGPVEKCNHNHQVSLVRQAGETGPFRTAQAAAYPSDMCKCIAECILLAFKNKTKQPTVLADGGLVTEGSLVTEGLVEAEGSLETETVPDQPLFDDALSDTDDGGSGFRSSVPTSTKSSVRWQEGVDFIKAGWHGKGDPLVTWRSLTCKGRYMADGGGLCSPGRWPIQQRALPSVGLAITDILDKAINELISGSSLTVPQHCLSVITGKFAEDPWEGKTQPFKDELISLVSQHGICLEHMEPRQGQNIDFPLLLAVGRLCGDPDAEAMRDFIRGAPLGVDEALPRTPAVWPPKAKWKLPDYIETEHQALCDNYPSAEDFKDALELDVEEQVATGWMLRMTYGEARRRFKEVDIAALAVVEDKPGKTRVIHDASNKVLVNHRIKVMDAELCPTALDVQAAVRGDDQLRPPILSLVADISKAHRRIPIREEDWGYMACAVEKRPPPGHLDSWNILVNTVGTYGVGSMSWHWARIGSLFQRISYYCCGVAYTFRYADDYQILSANLGGQGVYRPILRWLVLALLLGIPLKRSKIRGGFTADFIGNTYNWRLLLGGLSEARATWLISWLDGTLANKVVAIRELRSVVGRLGFSATLLRYLLPYLGPLYSWTAVVPDGAVRPIPVVLQLLMKWIRDRIADRRMIPLAPTAKPLRRTFMADAKAEGQLVVVGGFELLAGLSTKQSRWFSYRLDPLNAPWAFCRKGQAYRVISSLELFATLLCIMVLGTGEVPETEATLYMRGVTDNKSNEALIVKNMTTKFPSFLVLLELTEQLRCRGWAVELTWVRRDLNQTADDLTNEKWDAFDPNLRFDTPLEQLPWLVLKDGYTHALDLYKELEAAKLARREAAKEGDLEPTKRYRKKLRISQPWGD